MIKKSDAAISPAEPEIPMPELEELNNMFEMLLVQLHHHHVLIQCSCI
jgi:hypothetical protein